MHGWLAGFRPKGVQIQFTHAEHTNNKPHIQSTHKYSKYAGGGSSGASGKSGPTLLDIDMSKSNGLDAASPSPAPSGGGMGMGMGAGEVPSGPTDSRQSTPGGGDVAYDWKQYTNGKGKRREERRGEARPSVPPVPRPSPMPRCPDEEDGLGREKEQAGRHAAPSSFSSSSVRPLYTPPHNNPQLTHPSLHMHTPIRQAKATRWARRRTPRAAAARAPPRPAPAAATTSTGSPGAFFSLSLPSFS